MVREPLPRAAASMHIRGNPRKPARAPGPPPAMIILGDDVDDDSEEGGSGDEGLTARPE